MAKKVVIQVDTRIVSLISRFFEKKKISEIGEIMGKPEGTIKSQIHRALEELKKLMS